MQLNLRNTAFVVVLVLAHNLLFAQSLKNYGTSDTSATSDKTSKKGSLAGTWEAGVTLGPDFYYGDLNPYKFLPSHSISAAGGAFIMRQFTNVIGIKGTLLFGGLQGKIHGKEGAQPGNWSFKGTFLDFTINSVFNLSNLFSPYHSGRKLFVYGTIGFGVNAWNSILTQEQNGELTNPDQINGLQAACVIPIGLGLQIAITSKINAGIEYTVRTIFSDNVDQMVGGFKCDFADLLAFTASYRFGMAKNKFGMAKKKVSVQEYPYSGPLTYHPTAPEIVTAPEVVTAPESVTAPEKPGHEVPSASEGYDYVVQICAFAKHDYSVDWVKKHYHVDMPVTKERENGTNRYIIGHYYKDINVAKELCDRLRKKGIHDAWVIAYKNGMRHHVVIY